jgi:hypothetical protein
MLRVLYGLLCLAAIATPAETLHSFRPSAARSANGSASEVEFATPVVELEAGSLAHHLPQAMKSFQFSEPVWVIGYRTEVVDARGKPSRENYLCHTFFSDERVSQHQENEFRGIYSDAFTPDVRLPEGYGIPVGPDQPLHWMPMFNNRGDESARVAMKVILTVIRAGDLKKPLKPLYANLRSVQVPHLYFVPPGRDERNVTFEVPFDARIHFLGTHLHPYGASIELYNLTRGERVWRGIRTAPKPDAPMSVYSSSEGYAVHAGERFRITAVYENPTPEKIDAMAGLFILYSR